MDIPPQKIAKEQPVIDVTPFLLFDGNCADAMTFYKSCLGGELTITRVADTPMKDQMPPEQHHKVVYAHLKSGILEFSGVDWLHATRRPLRGNTVAMYLTGDSYDELKPIFDKLAVGGDENLLDELRDMPFGIYGHLADKHGVHWFFRGGRG
jgi:PhnB protein